MAFEIIKSFDELLKREDEWKILYQEIDKRTVFQSYEWNATWLENTEVEPYIFFHISPKDKSLDAIFPFCLDKSGTLRFIADIHSDHCTFLIRSKNHTEIYLLLKKLAAEILNTQAIKQIELKNLSSDDPFLGDFFTQFNSRTFVYQSNGYSFLLLPTNKDVSCFAHLKSKKRSELKRISKQFVSCQTDLLEYPAPFPKNDLKKLIQDMRQSGQRDENFIDNTLFHIVETLYRSKHLLIHLVTENERIIAANLIMHSRDDHYLLWIDLFEEKKNLNLFSYIAFMEYLCHNKEKGIIIDFGRGLYPYKTNNFLPYIRLQMTFFHAKSLKGFSFYLLKHWMKESVKPFYKKHKSTINRILGR